MTMPQYDPPFIISAWCGPEAKVEKYKEYADCGFNMVLGGDAALAKAVGIKAIVGDDKLNAVKKDDPGFEKNVADVVAKYSKDPTVVGLFLSDEPNVSGFADLGAMSQAIQKANGRYIPYINLLPGYASPAQLGAGSYEEYIRRFVEIVKPPLVSWDHYALLDNLTTRPQYFPDLETVSKVCREAKLPFLQIVCCVPHGMYRPQDEGDIRWQAYTSLAYGAKGVVWFTYTTVNDPGWCYHDAIIDAKGQRSERYDYVSRVNHKIAALGPLLVKLDPVRVVHTAPVPNGGAALDAAFPVASAKGGAMTLGLLQDADKQNYLFVVNRHFGYFKSWINTWQIAGPYQVKGKSFQQLFDVPFAPENPKANVPWKMLAKPIVYPSGETADEGMIDLAQVLGGEHPNSVAYMRTRVKSLKRQDVFLYTGSNDGLKVWLNGKMVHAVNGARGMQIDTDKIKVTLEAGWNTLLMKVTQANGPWSACARFVQPDTAWNAQPGNIIPIAGLEIEGQKLPAGEVGAREFTLILRDKAKQVMEISQETGKAVPAAFDPATQTLKVNVLAGEGKLFRLDR
ncbi:MAG: hypothetical protein NT031_00235 [Planctomycetota bacterium]|nr:hypothetical protein [Planctomycetota bacterium]